MESIICNCCFEVFDECLTLVPCNHEICRKCLNNNSNINISTLVNSIGVVNGAGGSNSQINCSNQITCKICCRKVSNYFINKEIQILVDKLKIKQCSKHSRKETNLYCLDCKSLICSNCKSDKLHKNHKTEDYQTIFFNALYYNIELFIMNKNKPSSINMLSPPTLQSLQSQSQSQSQSLSQQSLNTSKNNINIKLKDQRIRFNHTFFNNCKELQYPNFIKNKIKELIPKNGNYSKKEFYLKSIELNKNSSISYFNLALQLIDSLEKQVKLYDGTTVGENELYIRSIQLSPTPFCYFNLAIGISNKNEQPQPTQPSLNGADNSTTPSTTTSTSPEIQSFITINGKKMNKIELLIQCIEVDEHYSLAYYNLGKSLKTSTVLFSNSMVMKRKDLFIKYLYYHPNHAFGYNNLAILMKPTEIITLANGNKMTQTDLYNKAIQLNPKYSNPYINLASITSDPIIKRQLLLKALDSDETNSNAYNNLATGMKDEFIVLLNGKKMSKKELYLKSVECNPNNSNAINNLALYLKNNDDKLQLNSGEWFDKKQLYIKSIDIDPISNLMAYNNLANTLKVNESVTLLNGKQLSKKDLYIKSIGIDSTIARIFINLTKNVNFIERVQLEDGIKYTKKELFIKIIQLEPSNWIHYYNLANSMKLNEIVKLTGCVGASGTAERKVTKKELYLIAISLNGDDARLYNTLVGILKPDETIQLLSGGSIMNKKDLLVCSIELDEYNANTFFNLSLLLLHNEYITLKKPLSSTIGGNNDITNLKMSKRDLLVHTIKLDSNNSKAFLLLSDEIDSKEVITIYLNDGTTSSDDGDSSDSDEDCINLVVVPMTKIDLLIKSIDIFAKNSIAYYNIAHHLPSNVNSVTLLNGKILTKRQLYLKAISINSRYADAYFGLSNILNHNETIQLLSSSSSICISKSNDSDNGHGEKLSKKDLLITAIKLHPDPNYFYALANYFKNESIIQGGNLSEMYIKYNDIRLRPRDLYIQSFTTIPPFLILQTVDNPFSFLNDVMLTNEINTTTTSSTTNSTSGSGSGRKSKSTKNNCTTKPQVEKLLSLIDTNPNDPNYYFTLGYYLGTKESIQLLNGHVMSKFELYCKSIELDANHLQSYFSLYLFLHLSRDPDAATSSITLTNGQILKKENILLKMESIDKKFTDLMFKNFSTSSTTTTSSSSSSPQS